MGLTATAERGRRFAERHPDALCPCGRRAADHADGAWGECPCGRLVHRYGPGRVTSCANCREAATSTSGQKAS